MTKFLIYTIHNLSQSLARAYSFIFAIGSEDIDLYKTNERKNKTLLSYLSRYIRLLCFILSGIVVSEIALKSSLDKLKLCNLEINGILLLLCWITLALLFLYINVKLFRYKYRVSWKETEYLTLLIVTYINLRLSGLCFIHDTNKIEFFDILVFFALYYMIGSMFNYGWPKYNKADNYFIEDNPNNNDASEIEKKLIHKLKFALFRDKYEASFSIGIIGPWGIGKSSFLNLLKAEIETEMNKFPYYDDDLMTKTPKNNRIGAQEIVFFEFSPFLNHNEESVVTDFFTQLSNQLSKRSGILSQSLQLYSDKLLALVDKNKISQFVSTHFNNDKSVNEIYNQVYEILGELELKFIIFIDDMDRLNPKEILQVLKLIRNTSNFPNFVFVVPLDKEYIVNALRSLGDYANKNFIDKFFQLECYLPEIDSEKIIDLIINYIEKGKVILDENGKTNKTQLIQTIKNDLPLLVEYVQNFRDVKRFINQLHFEYNNFPNLMNEISIEDYLNLSFLKNKFPEFYRFILLNYESYFEINNGIINLKPNSDDPELSDESFDQLIIDLQNSTSSKRYNPDTSKYYFGLFLNCEPKAKYTCEESNLIKRTLHAIFNNYSDLKPDSLRRITNLKKIAFWRISNEDLSSASFEEIIDEYRQNDPLETRSLYNIKKVKTDNKLEELLTRLSFEFPKDEKTITAIILLAFDILRIVENSDYKTKLKVRDILAQFYDGKQINKEITSNYSFITKEKLKALFKENYINASEIDFIDKMDFIDELIKQKILGESFYFTNDQLTEIQIQLVKEKCDSYTEENWKANDYSIWRAFYIIKNGIESNEELNDLILAIRDFCKDKKLNVLFFNLLYPEPTSHLAYRLLPIVEYIFGNTQELIDFLNENYSSQLIEFPEIKEFLFLNHIVKNKQDIKFHFSKEILIGNFQDFGGYSTIDRKNMENSIQVFFENFLSPQHYNLRLNHYFYIQDNKEYWLFVSSQNKTSLEEFVNNILDEFILNIQKWHGISCTKFLNLANNEAYLIDLQGNKPINLISIQ